MAIGAEASKFLVVALGGASVIGVGGLVLQQGYLTDKPLDDSAFQGGRTSFEWKVEKAKKEIKDDNSVEVKVSVVGKKSRILNSKEWVCHVVGKTTKDKEGSIDIEGITEQIKNALGVKKGGEIDEEKRKNQRTDEASAFEKFVKNCKRHRTSNPTGSKSESTLDLGELKADAGSQYKFDSSEVTRLQGNHYISKGFKTKLGLDDSCDVFVGDKGVCSLGENSIRTIKFDGKTQDTSTTSDDKNIKLKIEEIGENNFPNNLKFTFETTHDVQVKLGESGNESIKLQGTNMEFKVKTNSDGTYSLERIWKLEELGKKLGLTCSESTCNLVQGKTINVWNSESSYIIGATYTGTHNITVTKDQANHNQGFKFTATPDDITLTGTPGATKQGTEWKIEKTNASYEIKLQEINKKPTWFLSKAKPTS